MRLAATAGLVLDPWQERILDVMLRERADGKWAAREVGYLVARQNGKGGVLNALALGALFLFDDEEEILFSAHEFKTAKKAYRQIKGYIEGAPHLHGLIERRGTRVVGFRQSNEDTSITLQSGAVLRFMARSNNTGRGFSAQRLIVDEAQECSEETRQALQYIVSAQANPQVVWTGTVPGPKNNGEVWESLRDRGRAGGDPILAWLEWSPEPGVDPESDEAVEWSNPGMPHRITMETVRAERAAATTPEAKDGLARERCSIWPDRTEADESVVDMAIWRELDDLEDERPSPVALSIEVSKDRKWASIGLAGRRGDGDTHVQIVQAGRGTGWVVDRVVELVAKHKATGVAVRPGAPAGSLIPQLEARSVPLVLLSDRTEAQACGMFVDGVDEQTIHHQGQSQVNAALAATRKRKAGDAYTFVGHEDADIAPVQAIAGALFALSKPPKQKPRSGTIW